ncbi:hypothetical protein [Nocardia wallacei]|nr:hypothetical protein [Nocardia wallacei]
MEKRTTARAIIPLEPVKTASGRMPQGGRGFTEEEARLHTDNGKW